MMLDFLKNLLSKKTYWPNDSEHKIKAIESHQKILRDIELCENKLQALTVHRMIKQFELMYGKLNAYELDVQNKKFSEKLNNLNISI